MDGITNGMNTILSSVMEKLHSNITRDLQEKDIPLNDAQLAVVRTHFEKPINPFEKLETRYQQDKYIQEHLNYLVSTATKFHNI